MSFGFQFAIAAGHFIKNVVSYCKHSNSLRARDDRNIPTSETSIAALTKLYVDGGGVF